MSYVVNPLTIQSLWDIIQLHGEKSIENNYCRILRVLKLNKKICVCIYCCSHLWSIHLPAVWCKMSRLLSKRLEYVLLWINSLKCTGPISFERVNHSMQNCDGPGPPYRLLLSAKRADACAIFLPWCKWGKIIKEKRGRDCAHMKRESERADVLETTKLMPLCAHNMYKSSRYKRNPSDCIMCELIIIAKASSAPAFKGVCNFI